MIQRLQCRDPFDLYRLFVKEGVEVRAAAWGAFELKARHKGLDPDLFDNRLGVREEE